ncbi:hypothetical protein BDB00DRAFT_873449 [Zychaea mexicana]|uniref:uncharacterized protein n=1 Tax=Zychaea mexicana TaxID=64656 RepID=UPI0022FE39C3|nr:uncharacterized protein BDB00DRAFT_873449 [Zychaea mexicana]KAI9492364.1 hypothetical protein BDB00DRAFT_873449 [Zychaea mexicana]
MKCDDLPDIQKEASDLFANLEMKTETIMGGSEKINKRIQEQLLDTLSDVVYESGHYDFRTNYDMYWLQSTLTQMLSCYKFDVVANVLPNSSEMDFVSTIWSILDRCFHNINVVPGRDRTCVAISARINADHGLEYGCSEVGKSEDVVANKKEVVETYLYSPKTMKDLFNRIRRRMKLSVMDCPDGYVCRVQETEEYKIPISVECLAAQIIPMLTLTLQAKNKKKGKPQFKAKKAAQKRQQKESIVLPSSLTTCTPSTTARKRKNEETN